MCLVVREGQQIETAQEDILINKIFYVKDHYLSHPTEKIE